MSVESNTGADNQSGMKKIEPFPTAHGVLTDYVKYAQAEVGHIQTYEEFRKGYQDRLNRRISETRIVREEGVVSRFNKIIGRNRYQGRQPSKA